MIDFLRGEIVHAEQEYIIMEVAGVGYRIFCTHAYTWLETKQETTAYIHQQVREDAILLYGFKTREEQRVFRRLINVSGIGPRVAIGIMSGITPAQLVTAIQQEDLTTLTKLPGVGKKTGQRMILDLKDKLTELVDGDMIGQEELVTHKPQRRIGSAVWEECRDGLLALGYSNQEVEHALLAVKEGWEGKENADEILRLALKQLYKG